MATSPSAKPNAPIERAALGRVGPVRFRYDENELKRADVQISLPPAYGDEVWATKLIPAERAEQLGEDACEYGQSGLEQVCTAEKEPGLALSLLPRPIDDYREAFEDSGVPAEELAEVEVDHTEGFRFTAAAEGAGTEYCFVPVGERTLLIARSFLAVATAGAGAIRTVMATIDLGT